MARLFLALMLGLSVACASSSSTTPPSQDRVGAAPGTFGSKPPLAARRDPETIIEAGDTLEIIVRRGAGEEKYVATVLASGVVTVSFQDINVQGLTEVEAEARVTQELSAVIKNPRVQVRLAQKRPQRPKNFYIFGEVKNAGKYVLDRNATLLHALGQSGGYTDVADLNKIVIISRSKEDPENPVVRVANVQSFLTRGDLRADLPVEDNDVIFVPRSGIGDWNHYYQKAVLPALNTVLFAANAVFIGKALQVLFITPDPQPAAATIPVSCWIARVLYGEQAWQVQVLRWYIWGPFSERWYGRMFADFYLQHGQQVAGFLKQHPSAQILIKPLFDHLLDLAISASVTRHTSRVTSS